MSLPRALIVGCGYVGQRLARFLNDTHVLYGLVRSTTHVRTLRCLRVQPLVVDLDTVTHQELSPTWYDNALLFYFAPPPLNGVSDTRLHRFLNSLTKQPSALIYVSTTGVYGDLKGAIADESAAINPQTERARRRASAEEISRVWCHERAVRRVVLRVPAIYGPRRLPLVRLRSGEPVIVENESPIINRIHVDDLVQACVAAANNDNARGIYNVTDGNAITMTAYLKRVAELASIPLPPMISMEEAHLTLDTAILSYLDESRRISNARMINELGIKLKYANVDEGIRSSLAEEAVGDERHNKKQ